MTYNYPELREKLEGKPVIHQRALECGVISRDRMRITLPDDFDFQDERIRGLGDVIALVAKPIAKLVGIKNCGGCDQRQDALNKAFPFQKTTLDIPKQSANAPHAIT